MDLGSNDTIPYIIIVFVDINQAILWYSHDIMHFFNTSFIRDDLGVGMGIGQGDIFTQFNTSFPCLLVAEVLLWVIWVISKQLIALLRLLFPLFSLYLFALEINNQEGCTYENPTYDDHYQDGLHLSYYYYIQIIKIIIITQFSLWLSSLFAIIILYLTYFNYKIFDQLINDYFKILKSKIQLLLTQSQIKQMDAQNNVVTSVDQIPDQIVSIDDVYISNGVCSNKGNSQGKVFFVEKTDTMFVAKLIVKPNDYRIQVRFLQQLKQNRFVPTIQYHRESAKVLKVDGTSFQIPVIVMQLAKRGDVFDFILDCIKYNQIKKQPLFHLSIPSCKLIYEQLLIAVQSIHDKQIINRDIKTQNLLFDENFQIKIGDFGAAAKKSQISPYNWNNGTPQFTGPQVIKKIYSGEKSDLFSCTVVLFNICTSLLLPFKYTIKPGYNEFQYEQNYKNFSNQKHHKKLSTFWKSVQKKRAMKVPDEFKKLFQRIFLQDQRERPTINDILQNEQNFFVGKASFEQYKKQMQEMYDKIISIQHQQLIRNRIHRIVQRFSRQHTNIQQNNLNIDQERGGSNFGERSILEVYIKMYESLDIKKQQFQTSILNKKDIFFRSQPALILAWIHFYVSNGIQKQDLSLFCFLGDKKLSSYNVRYSEQYSTINVEFQIVSKINTQQNIYSQQIEEYERILLEGKFLITHPEQYIKIHWYRQNSHDLLTQIALRDMKQCLIALQQYEKQNR